MLTAMYQNEKSEKKWKMTTIHTYCKSIIIVSLLIQIRYSSMSSVCYNLNFWLKNMYNIHMYNKFQTLSCEKYEKRYISWIYNGINSYSCISYKSINIRNRYLILEIISHFRLLPIACLDIELLKYHRYLNQSRHYTQVSINHLWTC